MRLRQIDIERFGIWRDWSSGELPAGLAVFFGPNETGKSTLLEFLRGMFFGFHQRSGFAPPDEPVLAGRLVCEHQDIAFQLYRRWTPSGGEVVEVVDDSGNRPAEEVVRSLCPLDETTFNAIFAVNLEDIAYLRTLEATATGELLYDLSLGIDRAVLGRVLARLQEAADPHRQGELLRGLLEERERLQRELQGVPEVGTQFVQLLTARKNVEQQCARAEETLAQWRERCQIWESLRPLLPLWEERCRVERELGELGALADVPEVFFRRVARLRKKFRAAKKRLEHLKEQHSQVKTRLAGTTINEALLTHATELEALRPVRNDLTTLQTTLNALQADQDRLDQELTNLRSRLGVDTLESPPNFPWGDVRRVITHWERIDQRIQVEEQKLTTDRATKERLQEQLRQKLQAFQAVNVPAALEERSRQATQLRKLAQLREQLASVENRQKELRAERLTVMKEALLPGRTWLFVAVPFVLGLALVLLSLLTLAIFPVSSLGWSGVLVGAILVGAGVAVKLHGERFHRSRADAIFQEWEALRAERERLVEHIAGLETAISAAPGYLPRELPALENEIRELEALGLLQSQLDHVTQKIDEEERQVNQLRAQSEEAARRVAGVFAQQGLPSPESPAAARVALETLRQYRRLRLRWESVNKRRSSLVRQRETWSTRLQQIAQLAGIQTPDTSLELVLDALLAAYDEAVAQAREKKQLVRQWKAVSKDLRLQEKAVRKLRTALRQHIQKFRRRTEFSGPMSSAYRQWQKARELHQKHEQITATLRQSVDALSPRFTPGEKLDELFAGLESRSQEAIGKVAEYSAQVASCRQMLERLTTEIETLAHDRRIEEKRLALATIEYKLGPAFIRERLPRLALFLFEKVRQQYEHERQPRILRKASRFLEAMTEGRYRRVWTPLAERVLLAEDHSGNLRRVDELSRGTREQLFLSLRLALASDWSARGVQLPLILDDVLVNFDEERVRAACRTLAEFAGPRQQILLLTCHEHITNICYELGIPVTDLTSAAVPGRSSRRSHRSVARAHSTSMHQAASARESAVNSTATSAASDAAERSDSPQTSSVGESRQESDPREDSPSKEQREADEAETATPLGSGSDSFDAGGKSRALSAADAWLFVPDPYPDEGTASAAPDLDTGETPVQAARRSRVRKARAA